MTEADFSPQRGLSQYFLPACSFTVTFPCVPQEVEPNSPPLESVLSDDSFATNQTPSEWCLVMSEAGSERPWSSRVVLSDTRYEVLPPRGGQTGEATCGLSSQQPVRPVESSDRYCSQLTHKRDP